MKQFTIIATIMIITLQVCIFALCYFIEMGRLRTVELERSVEINHNAIHRLIVQEPTKCQCHKEPSDLRSRNQAELDGE